MLSRRLFIASTLSALATPALASRGVPLHFFNDHTQEHLSMTWSDSPVSADISAFNHLCRDWRENVTYNMDRNLLDALATIATNADHDGIFTILSGYRTRKTNDSLDGSAANSFHLSGRALDIRHSRTSTHTLYEIAANTKVGGLGYYTPRQGNFIHIDTGPVRSWGAPSLNRPVNAGGNPQPSAPIDLNMDLSNPFPFSNGQSSSSFQSMSF